MLLLFCLIIILKYFSYKKTATFTLGDPALFNMFVNFITLFPDNSIKYKDIKEVNLHRGIIKKLFRLGTVQVISQATVQDAGIRIYNITNYQEVYDFLMEKIKD